MKKRKFVNVFGPPAAGKGEVSRVLNSQLGFLVVSTSDLIRQLAPVQLDRIRAGHVVDDDIMIPLFEKVLPIDGLPEHVVLDSPRSPGQVRWLKDRFPDARFSTIYLVGVGREEIARRLALRGGRDDDANIVVRLEEYEEYSKKTLPVLQRLTTMVEIDNRLPLARMVGEAIRFCKDQVLTAPAMV